MNYKYAAKEGSIVVNDFMKARLSGQADPNTFLDANGRLAYANSGLNLTINGDPHFSRFYILTRELTGTQPDTVTFTVRLVLTHGKLDVGDIEESITLVRDAATHKLLIDQATGGAHRDLGKGAEVVTVDVAPDSIKVTFDSDLDAATVAGGVLVLDGKGNAIDGTPVYASRVVTISGLDLKPGRTYKLVVLTTVRDVSGQNVASEYDLKVLGPVVKNQGDQRSVRGVTASPVPTPSPAKSPLPTPSPNS